MWINSNPRILAKKKLRKDKTVWNHIWKFKTRFLDNCPPDFNENWNPCSQNYNLDIVNNFFCAYFFILKQWQFFRNFLFFRIVFLKLIRIFLKQPAKYDLIFILCHHFYQNRSSTLRINRAFSWKLRLSECWKDIVSSNLYLNSGKVLDNSRTCIHYFV